MRRGIPTAFKLFSLVFSPTVSYENAELEQVHASSKLSPSPSSAGVASVAVFFHSAELRARANGPLLKSSGELQGKFIPGAAPKP